MWGITLHESSARGLDGIIGTAIAASQESKGLQLTFVEQFDWALPRAYNDQCDWRAVPAERGRISFDGVVEALDACRGPSTSLIRWKQQQLPTSSLLSPPN